MSAIREKYPAHEFANVLQMDAGRRGSFVTFAQPMSSCLEIGVNTQTGLKPGNPHWVNQDCHLEMHLPGGKFLGGVFDGHGPCGHQISHRIRDLFASMAASLASAVDISTAFRQAFAQCQAQIEREAGCHDSGATATLALVDASSHMVSLAHVGDSTALVIHPDGGIAFQTRDHKADAEGEVQRLQAHGAQIQNGRLCSHFGSFAMARSLGDVQWRRHGVIAEPEIVCGLRFDPGSALMLASDGVWDMWPLKDLVASVAHCRRPQEAAESIVTASASSWAAHPHRDDITALIVKPSTLQMAFVLQSMPVSLDHGFCTQPGAAAQQENQDCISKMHLPGDRFLGGVFDGHHGRRSGNFDPRFFPALAGA